MGHKEKPTKLDVQKQKLKKVFASLLDSEIAIMDFQLTLATEEEHIKGIKKVIKDAEKAKRIIYGIVHYEILVSDSFCLISLSLLPFNAHSAILVIVDLFISKSLSSVCAKSWLTVLISTFFASSLIGSSISFFII